MVEDGFGGRDSCFNTSDAKTGRRYNCNEATGQTQWLSDDDEEDGASVIEE